METSIALADIKMDTEVETSIALADIPTQWRLAGALHDIPT